MSVILASFEEAENKNLGLTVSEYTEKSDLFNL